MASRPADAAVRGSDGVRDHLLPRRDHPHVLIASDTETGDFAVAFRVVEIAAGIPWLLVIRRFRSARAARDDQARRYALGRLFDGSLIAGGALALALAFGADFAVRVLGGDSPSVGALEVLAVALLVNFFVAMWAFALLSLHSYRALLFNNVAAFLIGIGLTLVLVPTHGAMGAAISVTVTEVALALLNLLALVRVRPDLKPPTWILPRVAAAAIAVCVPLVLLDLPSVVEAAIAPLLFVGILAASGAADRVDRGGEKSVRKPRVVSSGVMTRIRGISVSGRG